MMAQLYLLLVISFSILIFIVDTTSLKLMPFASQIELIENQTFPLACTLLSNSQITFEWFFNGAKVVNSSNIQLENSAKFSFLTIQNVQRSHSGILECRVKDLSGSTSSTKTKIIVKGK